jgi:hypothetical protein
MKVQEQEELEELEIYSQEVVQQEKEMLLPIY